MGQIPEIHPRMRWASDLAMDIAAGVDQLAETGNKAKAVGSAVLADIKNASPADKAWITGSAVLFGANFSQARTIGTAGLELVAYRHAGPAAVIATGIGAHLLWYGAYGEVFSRGIQRSPETTQVLAETIKADKISLPGLAPGSLEPPAEIEGKIRRVHSRVWRRAGRIMCGKAGMALYMTLAELQGQTEEDQKSMRRGMLAEGTAFSVVNSAVVAGAMSSLGPEFVLLYNVGPPLAITAGKSIHDRLKKEKQPAEVTPLPVPARLPDALPEAA